MGQEEKEEEKTSNSQTNTGQIKIDGESFKATWVFPLWLTF